MKRGLWFVQFAGKRWECWSQVALQNGTCPTRRDGRPGGSYNKEERMRISIRVPLVLSAAALALSIGAAQSQEKLRVGTEGAYPPFNNVTADGQLVGFDIATAFCEEMRVECEFVTQDWDGIIPALQANGFDAIIASMSITQERLEQVDFTNKYYNTSLAIVASADTDIMGVIKEELAGKTIGAQGWTIHSNYREATHTDGDVKLYPSADEYKLDLINGRIDDITVIEECTAPKVQAKHSSDPVPNLLGPQSS